MATEAEIEAAAANVYGEHWNGAPEKMPGPKMKEVWRRLCRLALEGAERVRASHQPEAERDMAKVALESAARVRGMTITEALEQFERELPGWWWSVGLCSVSADASCGPDRAGQDAILLEDRVFDLGFDADLRTPATVVDALLNVLEQAKAARKVAVARAWVLASPPQPEATHG